MHVAPQFTFDFDEAERQRPVMEHFARLEALARVELSEENRCLAWVTRSDGRAWMEWWKALPNYRREGMLVQYRFEREHADLHDRPMRPYSAFQISEEELEQDRAIVESFKRDIRQAAIERRPLPLRESEDMSPLERLTFQRRLAQAITEGGVVVVTGG